MLAEFGVKANELTANTRDLVAQMAKMDKAELVAELQLNDLLRKRTKQAGLLVTGLFAWWFFTRKKKGKK